MPNVRSSTGGVTNRDLYDALGGLRNELGASIQRLDDKFTTLEAGRLTRLEGKVSDLQIEQINRDSKLSSAQASISGRVVIIWSMIGAIFVAFATALAYRLIVGANTK